MKWTQIAVVAGVLAANLAQPIAGHASETPKAFAGTAVGPTPVYQGIDLVTGAGIRVFQNGAEGATVEVSTPDVIVRKQVQAGRAVTRLITRTEDLSLTLDGRGLITVTDHHLGLTARGGTVEALQQARNTLRRSPAARAAATLLERMDLAAASPIAATLRGSQMLVASALTPVAPVGLAPVVDRRRVNAGLSGAVTDDDDQTMRMTANDCWTEYTIEAIAAWIEYEQCVDSEQWWDVPGMLACLAIYEMRAIGAFSAWAACVTLR